MCVSKTALLVCVFGLLSKLGQYNRAIFVTKTKTRTIALRSENKNYSRQNERNYYREY